MRTIQCHLCPKSCNIAPGKRGDCRIRYNLDGKLISLTYSHPCTMHIDPIEKKPLFHFYPGSQIFSVATAGCNLHCKNCQNWQISQANPEDIPSYKITPQDLVALAKRYNCNMIAYTYSEPLAFYEYTLDSSIMAESYGLKNVLVTAGYLNREPLKKLYRYSAAVNIDLKFFNNAMYKKITTASLHPVLDALILAREMDVWLEITNLIIPTLNDDYKEIEKMCVWIGKNLGTEVPLHFSRFHPYYLLQNLPATSYSTLKDACNIARQTGLKFVYIGNVYGVNEENTFCPNCGKIIIKRVGYKILEYNITDGKCTYCRTSIAGRW